MANEYGLCYGCMHRKGNAIQCPQCGYLENTKPASPQHLMPGTILHKKYLIGKVLGQGGFGITYLAWDLQLDTKLAIKEYMPRDFATRSTGELNITYYTNDYKSQFEHGKNKFLEEAKILAKYRKHPGIVPVRDFFEENQTAYLVMYYLEGIDLKSYLDQLGGKLPYEQAIHIILPIMDALKTIHKDGLLHRDISPDNIYITTEGEIKLLDFGAARHALSDNNKSLSVILKPGYAPEEQYRTKGRQGPWTDVYAVAATFYRMLVGKTPADSLNRLELDTLIMPSRLGISVPEHAEKALAKALAIKAQDRYQSIEEFQNALLNNNQPHSPQDAHAHLRAKPSATLMNQSYQKPPHSPQYNSQKPMKNNNKLWIIISSIVGGLVIVGIGVFLFISNLSNLSPKFTNNADNQSVVEEDPEIDTGPVPAPDSETEPKLETEPYAETDDPESEVVIVTVPDLYNLTEDEALNELERAGVSAEIVYEEDLITLPGKVFNQSEMSGTEIESDQVIEVWVNKGVDLPVTNSELYLKQFAIIDPHWDEAEQLFKEGKTEEALYVYSQAQKMASELYKENGNVNARYYEGALLIEMGVMKEYLGYIEHAVETSYVGTEIIEELQATSTDYDLVLAYAYGSLSWQLLLNQNPSEATTISALAVIYDPDRPLYQITFAHSLLLTGEPDEAYEWYLAAWDADISGSKGSDVIYYDYEKLIKAGYPSGEFQAMWDRLNNQ